MSEFTARETIDTGKNSKNQRDTARLTEKGKI